MKNIFPITIKIALIVLMVLCLFKMPFGYYQLVRFAALVGFALLAVDAFQNKRLVEVTLFICLALLFQPFIKVALEKEIWHWVDIAVSAGLLISIVIGLVKQFGIKKEIEMQPKKGIQKVIAREFLILLGIAVVMGLAYIIGIASQKIVQAKMEKLTLLKDSLKVKIEVSDDLPILRKLPNGSYEKVYSSGAVVPKDDLPPALLKSRPPLKLIDEYGIPIKKNQKIDTVGSWQELEKKSAHSGKDPLGILDDTILAQLNKPWEIAASEQKAKDSIDNAIKAKIQIIDDDISSKIWLKWRLQELWIWVIAILGIIVYPIRLLVLVTLWSLKTLKQ